MPLYLVNILWSRRVPQEGRPSKGVHTIAKGGSCLTRAITDAKAQFRRHYGINLAIDHAVEKPDPAGIYERVDCGSGHHYGICPYCGKGHGQVLMRDGRHISPTFH